MNHAIILSAGVGTRMRDDGFPKQYIEVAGRPVILWTLEAFARCEPVGHVVVTCAPAWAGKVRDWAAEAGLAKPLDVVEGGASRQESILRGLEACVAAGAGPDDRVVIHDAARPLVASELVEACLSALDGADGAMPVLPAVDTYYLSDDGERVDGLIDRSRLFAGQAPEAFRLWPYYEGCRALSAEELAAIRGSSEAARSFGMDVRMVPGDERNFKLTTPADLERFRAMVEGE